MSRKNPTYPQNLIGFKFGRLSPIKYQEKRKQIHFWLCKCDCGKEKIVARNGLITGNSKSCGCFNIEQITNRNKKDLTGKRYGRLLVQFCDSVQKNRQIWNCLCDCGETAKVSGNHLVSGGTKSCGCWRKEMPTLRIQEKSPSWNPKLTTEDRENKRNLLEFRQWRKSVFKRDNYVCQISGIIGGKLEPHHLFNWADYKENRFDVKNGITISTDLHKLFHSIFTKTNNNPKQFEIFKKLFSESKLDKLLELQKEKQIFAKQLKKLKKQIEEIKSVK